MVSFCLPNLPVCSSYIGLLVLNTSHKRTCKNALTFAASNPNCRNPPRLTNTVDDGHYCSLLRSQLSVWTLRPLCLNPSKGTTMKAGLSASHSICIERNSRFRWGIAMSTSFSSSSMLEGCAIDELLAQPFLLDNLNTI